MIIKCKPTSKCTLNNIAKRVHESGCNEVHAEFSKVITKMIIDKLEVYIESEGRINFESPLWQEITKTRKRCEWLLKDGFVEEFELRAIGTKTQIKNKKSGSILGFVNIGNNFKLVNTETFTPYDRLAKPFNSEDFPMKLSEIVKQPDEWKIIPLDM